MPNLLRRTDANIETLMCLEDVSNFRNIDRKLLYEKQMLITSWHRHNMIIRTSTQESHLRRWFGNPSFSGRRLGDIKFPIKMRVWCFEVNGIPDSTIALWLSNEGTSIEATPNCEPRILEILDEFIQKMIPQSDMPQ